MKGVIAMQNIRVRELRLTQQEFTPHNYSPVDALNRFFGFLDVAPKTADTYRKALKQFFSFLNSRGINHPKREDIITFKKDLDANGKKPATISLYLSAVRRFFSWCEANRHELTQATRKTVFQEVRLGTS